MGEFPGIVAKLDYIREKTKVLSKIVFLRSNFAGKIMGL